MQICGVQKNSLENNAITIADWLVRLVTSLHPVVIFTQHAKNKFIIIIIIIIIINPSCQTPLHVCLTLKVAIAGDILILIFYTFFFFQRK